MYTRQNRMYMYSLSLHVYQVGCFVLIISVDWPSQLNWLGSSVGTVLEGQSTITGLD